MHHARTIDLYVYMHEYFLLGHGPFSHMFEYGVFEQLKLEYYDQTEVS